MATSGDVQQARLADLLGLPRRNLPLYRRSTATLIHYDLYDRPAGGLIVVVRGLARRAHPSMVPVAAVLWARASRVPSSTCEDTATAEARYGFNLHEHKDSRAVVTSFCRVAPVKAITLIVFSYGGSIAVSTAATSPAADRRSHVDLTRRRFRDARSEDQPLHDFTGTSLSSWRCDARDSTGACGAARSSARWTRCATSVRRSAHPCEE